VIATSSAIRVFFDERDGWVIRNLQLRRSWVVDAPTAAVAVAFMKPSEQDAVASALGGELDRDAVTARVSALLSLGVLVHAGDGLDQALPAWAARGWAEAHDYLLATWSYPFEDYSQRGQEIDKERMRAYASTKADTVRSLQQKGTNALPLPGIEESLDQLATLTELDLANQLLTIASVAALPIEMKRSRTPGADYIHRTSPSGGSRHPSELYLLALSVPGMKRGVYHIATQAATLGYVADLPPEDDELKEMLPGAYRLPTIPKAIFVISTHFERNMYRYREPRTLRTVYYDAGHLGGLIEALADSDGLIAHGHHGFSDSYVAKLIRSDGLGVESPSYLVSIGQAADADPTKRRIGTSRLNA